MQDMGSELGRSLRKNRALIATVGAIVLAYVILELLGITCPIRYLTGVSCAGCGMTRAWLAVFRLDFSAAFACHPLFWLPVPAAVLFFLRNRISPKILRAAGIGMIALFLLVYILRMFDPEDTIVVFEPEESLFCRGFNAVRALLFPG